jgi:hypothetical protein
MVTMTNVHMNIPDTLRKIKSTVKGGASLSLSHDVFVILLIILVALASFGLGRLSTLQRDKTPIRLDTKNEIGETLDASSDILAPISGIGGSVVNNAIENDQFVTPTQKAFVASKTGKKYYAPWCTAVSRINDQNKVWFATKEDATTKGYTPASNCKGM